MALIAKFLLDTSTAARMTHPVVHRRTSPVIEAGLMATTAVLDAEALYSARSPAEYEQLWADRRAAYEYIATSDEHWQLALDAQRALARNGRHRAVGLADLLTAVLAQQNELVILHYDSDFERAATVLNFEHRWVAVRGSL